MTASVNNASLGSLTPAEQQRVTEILDGYLQQIENGESPDPDELIKQYPEWSEILGRYLESLGLLHNAARAMHGSEPQSLPAAITKHRRLGDYEIRRQIGRGGMGIVYEARQISLDRRVALKVLPIAAVLDKRQIARFRREAQAAAQLHHPHIVPVFGVGCEEGVHFYSMQLVEGQSIDRVIGCLQSTSKEETIDMSASLMLSSANSTTSLKHESTVEEPIELPVSTTSISEHDAMDRRYIDRVAELAIQAATALQHAHDYGVIHRDIKPSNLMLDREGKLWITDFGLAHIQSEADMTATGDIVGTLRYMSPEQAGGGQVIDQRTDIYSLGITLHEMLTLQQAFPSLDRQQLLRDIENCEPKRVRKLNSAIPIDLETIILKAISKDRDQRYSTAQEFADDLQRYLDGKPTLARRPTFIDQGTKWALRHQSFVASLLVMLTVALAGTSASLVMIKHQKDIADAHLADSQRYFQRARGILDQFAEKSRNLEKQPKLQRAFQELALDYYKKFLADAAEDETLVSDLASTHIRIGSVSEQLGDVNAALESYRQAVRSFRELAEQDPSHRYNVVLSLNNLGRTLAKAGRMEDAQHSYLEAQTALRAIEAASTEDEQRRRKLTALVAGNLGQLYSEMSQPVMARQALDEAVAIREQLLEAFPEDDENQIRLASNYHNLCDLLVSKDIELAKTYCETAIDLQQAVMRRRSDEVGPRADLALSFNNLGSIYLRTRQFSLAEQQYQRAIDLGTTLANEANDIPQLRHDLAISWNNLGQTRSKFRDFDGALKAYQAAEEQFREVLARSPDDAWAKARLGGTLYNQAVAINQLQPHDLEPAARILERAVRVQRAAVKAAPSTEQYARLLGLSLATYAQVLQKLGHADRLAEVRDELALLQAREGVHAR